LGLQLQADTQTIVTMLCLAGYRKKNKKKIKKSWQNKKKRQKREKHDQNKKKHKNFLHLWFTGPTQY